MSTPSMHAAVRTRRRRSCRAQAARISHRPFPTRHRCGFGLPTGRPYCVAGATTACAPASIAVSLTFGSAGTRHARTAVVHALVAPSTECLPPLGISHRGGMRQGAVSRARPGVATCATTSGEPRQSVCGLRRRSTRSRSARCWADDSGHASCAFLVPSRNSAMRAIADS